MKKRLAILLCGILCFTIGIGCLLASHIQQPKEYEVLNAAADNGSEIKIKLYKSSSNELAVLFLPANLDDSNALVGGLIQSDMNVAVVETPVGTHKFYSDTSLETVDLALETVLSKLKMSPVLIGYDGGATVLLEYMRQGGSQSKGIVLISPDIENENITGATISGGEYRTKPDRWLDSITAETVKQPTMLMTSTIDDTATPLEMTILYNKLSEAKIFQVGGGYNAEKNGVQISIITKAYHRMMLHSPQTLDEINGFLTDTLSIPIKNFPPQNLQFLQAGRILLAVGLGVIMIAVTLIAEHRSKNITISLEYIRLKSLGKFLAIKLGQTCIALPIAVLLAWLVGSPLGISNTMLLFVLLITMLGVVPGIAYIFKRVKGGGILRTKPINVNPINYLYALAVTLCVLVGWQVLIATGFPANKLNLNNIILIVLLWAMQLPLFYINSGEQGIISRRKDRLVGTIIYTAIFYLPIVLTAIGVIVFVGNSGFLTFVVLTACLILAHLLGKSLLAITSNSVFASIVSSGVFSLVTVSLGNF